MNWLLLRGLSREQRHWGAFGGVLAAALPEARVHALDLAGTGTEHARPSPTTVEAIADDARARWLALRDANPGPWGLFAMSLGGMVAMAWASAHEADFARVVLVNTSAANLSTPWRRLSLGVIPGIVRALVMRDPVRRERLVLSLVTRETPDLGRVAVEWAGYQRDRPVARAAVLRQLWAGSRFSAPPRLSMPTLVLAGGRDPLTDPACPRRLAAHLGAPLEVHPTGGHELALDAPRWLAERVAAWCASTPSPGGSP